MLYEVLLLKGADQDWALELILFLLRKCIVALVGRMLVKLDLTVRRFV